MMSNHAIATNFQRAAAAAVGALICLVVILAMFSASDHQGPPRSLSPRRPTTSTARAPGLRLTAENVLGLFTIGLISGTFGSMLSMGGGVLKMSFLLFFCGFHPGISKFAALLSYCVVAAGASYRYLKMRFVMRDVLKTLIPSSIVGIIFGAIIGQHLPKGAMTISLGIFLLFISLVMVKRILAHHQDVLSPVGGLAQEHDRSAPPPAAWRIALCGFPGGFLSAMLGISGGVVTNPLQQALAGIPIKNAIANTLAKACVTVPIACLMIMAMGLQAGHFEFWPPVLVALCLIPGSIIGSQLGPTLTRKMSPTTVHTLFGLVVFFVGINLLFFSK